MSLIKKCFESKILLNIILKDDVSFNSLKNKFPEIFADLTSARINPRCSCVNKVKFHLISKLENEKNYFEAFFANEDLRLKLVKAMESANNKLKKIN
jgi:hypothetical protein